MTKRYLMHCDYCGKRVIVKDASGVGALKESPLAKIPGGVPYIDPEDGKLKDKKSLPRRKMLKCPCCGRGVMLRKDTVELPEITEEKVDEEENNGSGREASVAGHEVPISVTGGTSTGRPEVPQ